MAQSRVHRPLDSFTPQARVVRARVRGADRRAGAGVAGDRDGRARADLAPTGSGKTLAAFLWALDRFVGRARDARASAHAAGLRLAAEGALLRRRAQPARAAARASAPTLQRRDPHRRHAAARARGDARAPARHADHDARVAVPDADLAGAGDLRRRRGGDRGRDPRGRADQARRAPGAHARAARAQPAGARRRSAIGLSATQNPLEEVGALHGRPARATCRIVDTGVRKPLDLKIHVPVESMVEPDARPDARARPARRAARRRASSIWPAIYPELLELVREHRSTIIFVNNRRAAERLALRLNELAPRTSDDRRARAHHGSLAREERTIVEELLKAGELPCLVATSSLELGIDMGAVDLVLQVESPKSVARGLQRIGRAGHNVGDVVEGPHLPEVPRRPARVRGRRPAHARGRRSRRPSSRATRSTCSPSRSSRSPRAERRRAGRASTTLHALVTRTYTYAELSRDQLENVLDMLDGRYPSEEFGELRPRIVWDRVDGTIRARKGARALAVTNAGTIPDRGLFAVTLPDGRRVGELDEEMVYEARPGQTFLLGASTWRIEEISRDRVIVTPAPGRARRGAVLEGRRRRPPARARRGDRRVRALGGRPGAGRALERDYDLDARAAAQPRRVPARAAGGDAGRARDRTIVVERFRDEIGDWRLCVLSPVRRARPRRLGAGAVSARIRDELGLESDAIWSDDGIIVHLPDADEPPRRRAGADRARRARGPGRRASSAASALFGARFRENAGARAADPARLPGQAHAAVAAAAEVADAAGGRAAATREFPIVLETYRECLRDVLDLPGLRDAAAQLHRRELSLVEVETPTASPFASSLLFDYVATYMYEGDTPNAERRAAALSLDRELLRELLGQEELRELIDPGALAAVEADLQRLSERTRADHARRAARRAAPGRRPDRGRGRGACRGGSTRRDGWTQLVGERRAIAAARRRRAALDRRRGRRPVPRRARRRAARRPAGRVPRRRARTRWSGSCAATRAPTGRSRRAELRDRYGVDLAPVLSAARAGRRPGARRAAARRHRARVVRPRGAAPAAPRLAGGAARGDRAGRPARARALPAELAGRRSPPARAGAGGSTGCARCSCRCRACALPRRGVGARRAAAPRRRLLAGLAGPAVRRRRARLGRRRRARARSRPRGAVLPRGRAAARARRRATGEPPAEPVHEAHPRAPARRRLLLHRPADRRRRRRAPRSCRTRCGTWSWAGEVTNDAFAPLRAPRLTAHARGRSARGARAPAAAFAAAPARRRDSRAVQGRWSLTAPLFGPRRRSGRAPAARSGRAAARALRHRHPRAGAGRGRARRLLRALRLAGRARDARRRPPRLLRRGARRRAVRAAGRGRAPARAARRRRRAAARARRRPTRRSPTARRCRGPQDCERGAGPREAGAHVVLAGAEPVLYVERGGKGLLILVERGRPARARRAGRAGRRRHARPHQAARRSSASTASRGGLGRRGAR